MSYQAGKLTGHKPCVEAPEWPDSAGNVSEMQI